MSLWSLDKYRILIVDDIGEMRTMVRGMVTDLGARHVETASSGEAALDILARQAQDIVLCDYNLGRGKDGQQILEEARARNLLPYASIVILITAESTMAMVMGALEFEPDDYLTKPFTRRELQARLQRLQVKKACLRHVSAALQAEDLPGALAACDAAIQAYPRYRFELTRTKGQLLLRLQRSAEAAALYRAVLDERELPWAALGLGRALFEQNELTPAKQQFEHCLDLNPNMVAALDWIAQIHAVRGETADAQNALHRAAALSPKNTQRQQTLGATALANGDIETAETAYRKAVQEGKHSIFCTPDTFGGLAQTYLAANKPDKARLTLTDMTSAFEHAPPEQRLRMSLVTHEVQDTLGDTQAAQDALSQALDHYRRDPSSVSKDASLAIAQAALAAGLKDEASAVMEHLVRSHHDDDAILGQAQQLFTDAGMESYGADLIGDARKAIVQLNNDGVQLARDGQLRESVSLLLKASKSLPENATISLNAAQSLILLMRAEGASDALVAQTRSLLQRARANRASDERYDGLRKQLEAVLAKVVPT